MAEDDIYSIFDKEEEESKSTDTSAIEMSSTDVEEDNIYSIFDKEDEVVPTTTTSETTKGLDPKELYTAADDQQYAVDSYGEESSPGVMKPKTYDEFIKDDRFLSTADK